MSKKNDKDNKDQVSEAKGAGRDAGRKAADGSGAAATPSEAQASAASPEPAAQAPGATSTDAPANQTDEAKAPTAGEAQAKAAAGPDDGGAAKGKAPKAEKPEKPAAKDKESKAKSDGSHKAGKSGSHKEAAKDVKSAKPGKKHGRDFSYTQNREVSWLNFDNRVLDEAFDESVPLFERLKFVEIFGSNLDEWFMIRIGGLSDLARLKHEPTDNKSNKTPSQQLDTVFGILPTLLARQETAWATVTGELAHHGLTYVEPSAYTEADISAVAQHFDHNVAPIISPQIVDPRHPFPNLRNSQQYVACSLDGPTERNVLGIVEVPPSLPRVVALPGSAKNYRYTLIEDVIITCLSSCFGDYKPTATSVIRVTRNADIDPDGEGVEEEEDYRQHMKKVLKKRQRLQPIRLEIRGSLDKKLEQFIAGELELTKNRIFHVNIPLDLGFVYGLEAHIPNTYHGDLVYQPFEPQISPMVDMTQPMREQVEDHDVLLFYPYESMLPLLTLLREASADDDCISIKITLYRVAKQSHLCESLIQAAENGKDVTVLMELRARFDEANNIAWAERLEAAGCTVIYGSEGFKCHSKICQITYHNSGNISRITCLGTGNFNEKTAKLYSDFMLLTAHQGIAEDGNVFFRNLSLGNLRGSYRYLGVAPAGLKPLIMRGLNREIERARAGQKAQVFMKMNSLTDRDVIDKISEACEAGVRMIMIIRGIACIRANIPGKTDGLVVREIVGRFLEHARVYAFGVDCDTVYLSSADMMTRNTERRVEIAYPVFDAQCRSLVIQYMNLQLADNVKARQLTADGTWARIPVKEGEPLINSQEVLLQLAYLRAHEGDGEALQQLTPMASIMPNLSPALASQFLKLPNIGTYPKGAGSAGTKPKVRKARVLPRVVTASGAREAAAVVAEAVRATAAAVVERRSEAEAALAAEDGKSGANGTVIEDGMAAPVGGANDGASAATAASAGASPAAGAGTGAGEPGGGTGQATAGAGDIGQATAGSAGSTGQAATASAVAAASTNRTAPAGGEPSIDSAQGSASDSIATADGGDIVPATAAADRDRADSAAAPDNTGSSGAQNGRSSAEALADQALEDFAERVARDLLEDAGIQPVSDGSATAGAADAPTAVTAAPAAPVTEAASVKEARPTADSSSTSDTKAEPMSEGAATSPHPLDGGSDAALRSATPHASEGPAASATSEPTAATTANSAPEAASSTAPQAASAPSNDSDERALRHARAWSLIREGFRLLFQDRR